MSPEQDFITQQLPLVEAQIKQLTIMQKAWGAGGDAFKAQLDDVTGKLGGWIAVKESLEKQLAELSM